MIRLPRLKSKPTRIDLCASCIVDIQNPAGLPGGVFDCDNVGKRDAGRRQCAVCARSSLGWLCFTGALGRGFQGYLAFPLAIGGSMSVVSAVGILCFKERLTPYGYAGVLCGILGIIVLVTA